MDVRKLPDWRLAKATEVTADSRLSNGNSVKKGDLVLLVTVTVDSQVGAVSFTTPGPSALAVSIAIRAAREAVRLRSTFDWQQYPRVRGKHLPDRSLPLLFDYFEQAMIAVTFSFQALETFANQLIANSSIRTHRIGLGSREREVGSEELERLASTEEKMSTYLPLITGRPSPKGTRVWTKFMRLKKMRDTTIHLKSFDHYRRGEVDRHTLYYRFLNSSIPEAPRLGIELIRYFSDDSSQGWLDEAERRAHESALSE